MMDAMVYVVESACLLVVVLVVMMNKMAGRRTH